MSKLTKGYGSTSIQQILTDLKTYLTGKFALKTNIPTKVSDLTNDSGFITKIVDDLVNYYLKSEVYSKSEVDALVTAIKNSRFESVNTLPTEDIKTNVIYLVPSSDPQASNIKDEYINLDGTTTGWEKIGSTDIDLSGYVTITQLNTALANYVTSTNLTTILADYATTASVTSVISTKADKVSNATVGNFAGLDANGNLVDSGIGLHEDVTATGNPAVFSTISEQLSKQTTVNIEPIQDLHGYDKPWSGGTGKNKAKPVPNTTVAGVTYTNLSDGGLHVSGTSSYSFSQSEFVLKAGSYILSKGKNDDGGKIQVHIRNASTDAIIASVINLTETPFTLSADTTVRHRVVVRDDNSVDNDIYPMIRLATETDPTFAPYTNICPISGLDSVVVERCGKNQLPLTLEGVKTSNTTGTWSGNQYVKNGITFTVITDENNNVTGIKANGTASGGNAEIRMYTETYASNEFKGYKLTGSTGGSGNTFAMIAMYSNNGTSWVNEARQYDGEDLTISDYNYIRFAVIISNGNTVSNQMFYPMVRFATVSDATFEPYQSTTSTTTLPTTVYGGTLDLTNGRLVVDRAYIASYSGQTLPGAWISDRDVYTGSNSPTTGAQVVYELATPVITTITPSSLSLLKGLNVVSTNGDTVEVTFNQGSLATLEDVADANAFKFDKVDIANMEGDTASKAYYVGNYILREDGFYRITADIANGAAITSNNTTKATVGRELSNIRRNINSPQCSSSELTSGDVETCDLNDYISLSFVEWKTDADAMGKLVYSSHVFPVSQLRSIISDRGYIKLQFAHLELRLSRTGSDLTMQIDSSQSGDYTITVFYQYFVTP